MGVGRGGEELSTYNARNQIHMISRLADSTHKILICTVEVHTGGAHLKFAVKVHKEVNNAGTNCMLQTI